MANHKRLKVALALEVRKLDPLLLTSKLGEFPIFDKFFSDLADFWDWDNFFDFLDFLAYFTPLSPNTSTLTLSSFLPEASFLLLFLLKVCLLPLFLLEAGLLGDLVVFNYKVSGAVILLKLWINWW